MEQDILKKIQEQDEKLNKIFTSVEKTRKYFQIIMWITVAMVVLPAIGLIFIIPSFINTYTSTLESLI
jgi:type II secretory pathway component PulF